MKVDHFYIKVDDLGKAIKFYEQLLRKKVTNREGDRWADFQKDNEVYLGIFNAAHDKETPDYGDNITLSLKTENVAEAYKEVKDLKPKVQTKIFTIKQPELYKYFQFEDPWGNVWEVSEYNY
jgi:predicted enzyme related to lactoylglutathione lyase